MNWKGNERLLICFVLNWIMNLNCRFCMTMMVEINVWKMGSKICDGFPIISLRGGGGGGGGGGKPPKRRKRGV